MSVYYLIVVQVWHGCHWAKIKMATGCIPSGGPSSFQMPLQFLGLCPLWTFSRAEMPSSLLLQIRNLRHLHRWAGVRPLNAYCISPSSFLQNWTAQGHMLWILLCPRLFTLDNLPATLQMMLDIWHDLPHLDIQRPSLQSAFRTNR